MAGKPRPYDLGVVICRRKSEYYYLILLIPIFSLEVKKKGYFSCLPVRKANSIELRHKKRPNADS